MRSILLVLPVTLASAPAFAQQVDEQLWLQTNVHVPIAKKTRLTIEGIARWSDRNNGLFHTEIGGILSYKIADNVEIGFGYRHVAGHNGNTADDEDRLRQHVVATFGRVSTRLRVDERFHPDGDEIGIRIRPLARYNHPIGKGFALFVSHESFIMANSTNWGQRSGYDRMRNIAGVVIPVSKKLSADVGYLNQYRFGKGGARDQMDHAMTVQLSLSL